MNSIKFFKDKKILAIDGDPNPNLALTLGMSRDAADAITSVPANVMKRGDEVDGVVQMVPAIPREEIIAKYAAKATDYVDLWSNLPVGVDRKAPLSDFYPADVIADIVAGLEEARHGGRVVTYGEIPSGYILNAETEAATVQDHDGHDQDAIDHRDHDEQGEAQHDGTH